MAHGFVYLVAIRDWQTRHVLAWRLSTTQDTAFCLEALDEAIERYGPPEIFNTDQGCQFTRADWTEVLTGAGIAISMDGKGRWLDNVFIERLWRSLKYECVYLNDRFAMRSARSDCGCATTTNNVRTQVSMIVPRPRPTGSMQHDDLGTTC